MRRKRLSVRPRSVAQSADVVQIAQMEVELPSMPVSIRQTYQGRLATSRQALEKVNKSLVSFDWPIQHQTKVLSEGRAAGEPAKRAFRRIPRWRRPVL